MTILEQAKDIEDEIINNRRNLHKIPELGLYLPKTVSYIKSVLDSYKVPYKTLINGNAIVAEIYGNEKGKCIAVRADMDALPIKEETGFEYCSIHEGKMHACGHDAHSAMALGAVKLVNENKHLLKGAVKFLFQPGEEIPGGAKPMIEEGAMENPKVDAIIGLHAGSLIAGYKSGSICIKSGALMASMDRFKITVNGKGGHGANPHTTIDPIIIVSEINLALQKIISREISPTTPALISICQIHGGTTQNIIPDSVWVEGTSRTLDEKTRDLVEKRMKEIATNIAKAYGATADVVYERFYPVVVNDSEFTDFFEKVAIDVLGKENVNRIETQTMGGEDMAFFLQKAKGTFFFLNNMKPDKDGKIYPHHNSKFNLDESQFYKGSALLAETCIKYLS